MPETASRPHPLVYPVCRAICWLVFHAFFRVRIHGRHNVPATGPVLLVVNHISLADPPFVSLVTHRPVAYMAMAELFARPGLGQLVTWLGAFPVDRSRLDARAAREAVRRLRAHQCVGLFPEGGLRSGRNSVLGGNPDFKPGAADLALLGRAAVVPVVIRGTPAVFAWRNWLRRLELRADLGAAFCLWEPHGHATHRNRQPLHDFIRDQVLAVAAYSELPHGCCQFR